MSKKNLVEEIREFGNNLLDRIDGVRGDMAQYAKKQEIQYGYTVSPGKVIVGTGPTPISQQRQQVKEVTLQADRDNTDRVFYGGATVNAETGVGVYIEPGDSVSLSVPQGHPNYDDVWIDLAQIFIDGTADDVIGLTSQRYDGIE